MDRCPIFHLKKYSNSLCFKAWYVCKGYLAVYGQDYMKATSPTAHKESFRILAHLGAALDWEIE